MVSKELHAIEHHLRAYCMSYKIRGVAEIVSVKRASLELQPGNRCHSISNVGYVAPK